MAPPTDQSLLWRPLDPESIVAVMTILAWCGKSALPPKCVSLPAMQWADAVRRTSLRQSYRYD